MLINTSFKKSLPIIFGSFIAQVIALLSPIALAHLFMPEDFGLLSALSALVLIFGGVASCKYDAAIVTADNKRQAIELFQLSVNFSILASMIISLIIIFFTQFTNFEYVNKLTNAIYLIPIWILAFSIFMSSKEFLFYIDATKDLNIITIGKSLYPTVLQVIAGLFAPTSLSLIVAKVTAECFSCFSAMKRANVKIFVSLFKNKINSSLIF